MIGACGPLQVQKGMKLLVGLCTGALSEHHIALAPAADILLDPATLLRLPDSPGAAEPGQLSTLERAFTQWR